MPLRQVNLHSATTEELFERLAWFYATAQQAQIYDAEGQPYSLSTLVNLSRGKIPFPPRFAQQNDLVQKNAFLQSLKVQNICCTYGDWSKFGRIPESMFDQQVNGQWPFLSIEGSRLRTDLSEPLSRLNQLKTFPIYLLELSNQKIGRILGHVIDSLPPSNRDTLSSVFQLQQVEIVLQNALYSQKGETTDRLRKLMRTRISDYNSFVHFKKDIAVTYRLWERTHQKFPDQDSMEWTRQLIKCQMFVTMKHQGPLRDRLLQALLRLARRNERGNPDTPIGFMDHIEAVFDDQGLAELHESSGHKLVTIDGCKTAQMKHHLCPEIGNSLLARQSDKARKQRMYDSWEFFQAVNWPLYESEIVKDCHANQQMIDLCLDASDLLNDSPANRFNESESQKLRDEPLPQAVTKLYDPSNVFDGVSNDENRNPQVQPSDAQILKNKKVLLRPAASPPPPHSCLRMPPSPYPPKSSDIGSTMHFDDPFLPKSRGAYKVHTPGKKATMVRRTLIPPTPPSDSPKKGRRGARSRSKADKPTYDPIGAMQSRQQMTERRSQLHLEYKKHQMASHGIPSFVNPGGTTSESEDI